MSSVAMGSTRSSCSTMRGCARSARSAPSRRAAPDRELAPARLAPRLKGTSPTGSVPAQRDPDVARHAARIVDDFVADVVALRLQATLPELVDFLGDAGQRLLPARLGLVDGAAIVGAKTVGKPEDLDRHHAVLD